MIEKFKINTKIKLISLLSSIVLWMYVMAIVDPQETRVFEDIDITINNMNELEEKDLIIYPEEELTMDISITGKLSDLNKMSRDSLHISGQIKDPIEGKNELELRASTPGQVSHEIKSNTMIVNLEKVISDKKSIATEIVGSSKADVDDVIIDNNQKTVSVSGPRTLVNQVEKVVGVVDVESKKDDFSTYINLKPVDENGDEVKGLKLDQSSIKVNITFLREKTVDIKIVFKEELDPNIELGKYKSSAETVTIKGQKDVIDSIDAIETETIDISKIGDVTSKDVYLKIPQGVTANIKYITIELETVKIINESFEYTSQEVEIRNKKEDTDISAIVIPPTIKVDIEYQDDIGTVDKSDIVLYIDLSEELTEGQSYSIKYETQKELTKVNVEPNKI